MFEPIEVAFLSAIRPRYILPPFDLIFMISKLRHGIEARGLAVAFPGNALGLYLLLSYQHCCTIQLEAGQYDFDTAFTLRVSVRVVEIHFTWIPFGRYVTPCFFSAIRACTQ